jgi:sialate O-acetylesterase
MKSNFVLADVFNDNMVFQAGKPIRIFGKCKKNIELSFKLLENEISIKTKNDTFMVEFPGIEERETSFSVTIQSKKDKIVLYNCVIGDVYLFLGGMNISMPLSDSYHNQDYDNLSLRFFSCSNEENGWLITDKSNFEACSALAYLFAKGMHEVVKNPIGIINCTHPDSRIFSWMSSSDIEVSNEVKLLTSKYSHKEKLPLYSNLKDKITPHQVKAIVFYQGENDYPYYSIYENALRSIIKCLRFDFDDLKLPIFIIQIAGYNHPEADDYSVSMIRIAQAKIAAEKEDAYLVPAIDFGDPEMINPKDKHLVAKRLSNVVLEKIYKIGKNNTSPTFFSYQIYPDKITILTKDNYLNLVSKSGQYLGFSYSVNGIDFYPLTDITITNNIIEIKKDIEFTEIRYAMKKYPICDIITSNNLPLLPFQIKF